MKQVLVIGSRGSKLALIQAHLIQSELQRIHPQIQTRIEVIKTSGDVRAEPLSVIGGKGVFTKELEDALLDSRIDLAVHSLKDLPTIIPDGLLVAAIGVREDPRDALLVRGEGSNLQSLKPGAVIGTSSTRRMAQLKHLKPDATIKDLRGNVDTRLTKLDRGEYDAVILAAAGLRRLGLDGRISQLLSPSEMLPSPGQGALAIEVRNEDAETIEVVQKLDHAPTRIACSAERSFLRALGGGCQLPIAAHAVIDGRTLHLDGLVAAAAGDRIVRANASGSTEDCEALGRSLADNLMRQGANKLLQDSTL